MRKSKVTSAIIPTVTEDVNEEAGEKEKEENKNKNEKSHSDSNLKDENEIEGAPYILIVIISQLYFFLH